MKLPIIDLPGALGLYITARKNNFFPLLDGQVLYQRASREIRIA